jgi:excisionase family DNA binding protein
MVNDLMLSVNEAAKMLGVSRASAYRLVGRGVIPTVRLSERIQRVPLSKLERLLNGGKCGCECRCTNEGC